MKRSKSGPASAELAEIPARYTPDYWDEACKHLVKKDRVMKRLIPQFGDACLQARGDAFTTLARSIVGQQISVKAAQTVWDRSRRCRAKMTPANVLKLKVDDMRGRGPVGAQGRIPGRPGHHFDSGTVHVKDWQSMDDEAIIAELVAIRGIGRWTAEMFLIFHLMRPNVLPLDDVGLISGISQNYFSGESRQPQRRARGGRRLGAVLQRRDLVYLALAGPITGRVPPAAQQI
jgi:DNA-3-methyladenine glycosylase II